MEMEMLPCWTSVKWDADYTYSFSGSISSLQSVQELWWQIHHLTECTVTAPHPRLDTASRKFRAAIDEEINRIMLCTVLGSEMEKRDIKIIYYIQFYTFLWSLSILMSTSVKDTLEELLTHCNWVDSSTVCITFVFASNSMRNLQLNLQLRLSVPQNNCNRTDFPMKTSLNEPHETQYAARQWIQTQQAVNLKWFSLKQVILN